MCVQPEALARRAIQYIVLYCLTPPLFHRYSGLNLCPPYPARDGTGHGIELRERFAEGVGIRVVNSSPRGFCLAHFSQRMRKMGHPISYRNPCRIGAHVVSEPESYWSPSLTGTESWSRSRAGNRPLITDL